MSNTFNPVVFDTALRQAPDNKNRLSSAEILAARNGKVSALLRAIECLPADFSQAIFDAILANLHLDLVESLRDSFRQGKPLYNNEAFQRAYGALCAMRLVGEAIEANPSTRRMVIAKIRGNMRELASWMLISFGYFPGEPYRPSKPVPSAIETSPQLVACALVTLMGIDIDLAREFLSYGMMNDVAALLWVSSMESSTAKMGRKRSLPREFARVNDHLSKECPILEIFHTYVKTNGPYPETNPILKSFVNGRIGSLNLLASSTVRRASSFYPEVDEGMPQNIKLAAAFSKQLFDITRFLILDVHGGVLREEFSLARMFEQYTRLLDSIARRAGPEKATSLFEFVINSQTMLFDWATSSSHGLISNVTGLARGNLLRIVTNTIKWKVPPAVKEAAKALLLRMVTHTVYPRMLKMTEYTLIQQPKDILGIKDPKFHTFASVVKMRNNMLLEFRDRQIGICDNLNHAPDAQPTHYFHGRTCSRCHSVMYCSEACQRTDWKARHRKECRVLHADYYLPRKHRDSWYRHNLRSFHLSLIISHYNNRLNLLGKEGQDPRFASNLIASFIAIVDMTHEPTEFDLELPERYINRKVYDRSLLMAQDKRVGSLIRELVRAKDANVRLVEGVFAFGHEQIYVMAKLWMRNPNKCDTTGTEDFKVLSSVVRIGPKRDLQKFEGTDISDDHYDQDSD
ncbi:hypothetical protein FA15DRAFT_669664 [Coprinopsis marcescibilis]|uniref:MYND-type domain-containing protein n=1 Tax=Coprinopsis marcescibilis TaxID=230819 RepID=A0A5C3KWV2_COPMA|nr:hypothetical protein FA15DRAFT_669664 [Coprinopsis marcescibilis]